MLSKAEKAGLQAVGKNDVKKGDNGIDLGEVAGGGGIEYAKAEQGQPVIEEAAEYFRYTVPEGLSRKFFDSAQWGCFCG